MGCLQLRNDGFQVEAVEGKAYMRMMGVMIASMAAFAHGAVLLVNGSSREADAPYFRIYPGRENHLEFRDADFAGGQAELETRYPDGRRHVQKALVAADGMVSFALGRFAVPAQYEYVGGDVWRHGTCFKLTLATRDLNRQVHLYQGPARREDSEALWLGEKERYLHNANGASVAGPQLASVEWREQGDGGYRAEVSPLPAEAITSLPAEGALVVRIRRIQGDFVLYWDGKPLGGSRKERDEISPVDIPLPEEVDFSKPHQLELRPENGKVRLVRGTGIVCLPRERIPLAEQGAIPRYGAGSAPWRMDYRRNRGRQMNPPYEFSLAPSVLENQDDVTILLRSAPSLKLSETQGRIECRRKLDGVLMRDPLLVTAGEQQAKIKIDVNTWPAGDYEISFKIPCESGFNEGPVLRYHRSLPPSEGSFALSPYAPWRLMRDTSREDVVVEDFAKEIMDGRCEIGSPDAWTVGKVLRAKGDIHVAPAVLHPNLKGIYAVFIRAAVPPAGCILYARLGRRGVMRPMIDSDENFPLGHEQFFGFIDDSDAEVTFTQFGYPDRGIASLRFIPVTRESMTAFQQEVENPPMPLGGVCDWLDAFVHAPRMEKDIWDNLVEAHRDIGIREMQWALGRSTLLYHSRLPDATRFPAHDAPENPPHLRYWQDIMKKYDAMAEITEAAARRGMVIAPWLTMNRHYGSENGEVFDSEWFTRHVEWHEHRKHNPAATDNSRSCFFFRETRLERINVLMEVVKNYPVDRLILGGCRQQPMLAYHPDMVRAYKEQTGIDPERFDASDGAKYMAWIRWRADFFTQLLRELRQELATFEAAGGRKIRLVVRMPAADRLFSLAQGFDVETWGRESLVDRIELEGAEDFGGRSSMDVTHFVELGRRYGMTVWGGVNSNTIRAPEWSPVAAMRRALAQYDAGVKGLQIYESNNWNSQRTMRWFIPLLGNPLRMKEMLAESNLEAVWPTVSTNCFAGIDNHSTMDAPSPCAYDVYETGRHEL